MRSHEVLFCYFLVILMSSSTTTAQIADSSQPRYFNGTFGLFDYGAYNATTLATVTGALLFIALNTAFVTLFLNPNADQKSSSKAQDLDPQQEYYAYYDYDTVKRYV